jgi:N-acetylglucosaminyl-diphospho-decaprenol L-rhamnosyltransferase
MIHAVVLTFSAPPQIVGRCLRALLAPAVDAADATSGAGSPCGPQIARVHLVCNAGRPPVGLDDLLDDGRVVTILSPRNLGYAGGMNLGISAALAAGAEQITLLNDDVFVRSGWLDPLVDELADDARVGVVQPKLLIADSSPPRVNSLGVTFDRYGAGLDIGYGDLDRPRLEDLNSAHDIALFSGGAVLTTAAFWQSVGLFDERFFLYYEDVDLALRGAAAGWRYRCAPASVVDHLGGASAGASTLSARFQNRNRLWIAFSDQPWRVVARSLGLSARQLRHRPRYAHLHALLGGLAGAPRRLRLRRSRH